MPTPQYEEQVREALRRQFRMESADVPDAVTLECLKRLALLIIRDEETSPAAVMAAHVVVPNYLYDDWVFHKIFVKCVEDCRAGRECVLGLDLTEAADDHVGKP